MPKISQGQMGQKPRRLSKRLKIIAGVVFLVLLLSCGIILAASSQGGSENDPLITKSYLEKYINETVMGQISSAVEAAAANEENDIDALINQYKGYINEKVAEFNSIADGTVSNEEFTAILKDAIRAKLLSIKIEVEDGQEFILVAVPAGKKLNASVGTELLLRSGVAKSPSGKTVLVSTAYGTFAPDTQLAVNILYIVTETNSGITAQTESKFLIRGSYNIE